MTKVGLHDSNIGRSRIGLFRFFKRNRYSPLQCDVTEKNCTIMWRWRWKYNFLR